MKAALDACGAGSTSFIREAAIQKLVAKLAAKYRQAHRGVKADSSRAIAVAITVRRLPYRSSDRKRARSLVYAFHAISALWVNVRRFTVLGDDVVDALPRAGDVAEPIGAFYLDERDPATLAILDSARLWQRRTNRNPVMARSFFH